MDLSYNKLTSEEAASQLETTDGWKIVSGALTKTFEFGSYSAGVLFGNAVAYTAEGLNHHPDLMIGYKRVTVSMVTHDAGGGLTAYDFELARRIDRLGS